MEHDKFQATCKYVTVDGKPFKSEGDISIRKKAKELIFILRIGFLERQGLALPKKIIMTLADLQK